MITHTSRLSVPVPAPELFAWHERPGAFERLTPPWQTVRVEHMEGIRTGDRAVFRVGPGPGVRWVAEHRAYSDACTREGEGGMCEFRDIQVEGPFRAWTHTHRMIADGDSASILEDHVEAELPGGALGELVGGPKARAEFDRMFGYRHRVTAADLARHAAWQAAHGDRRLTVAITGASGLLGRALAAFLTGGGHRVVRLVRSRGDAGALRRGPAEQTVYWNPDRDEIDMGALRAAAPDAVVHLAGEPVYGLAYTADKKRRIWESRTRGTDLIARAVAQLESKPVLLSASASGYYGSRGSAEVTEADGPGLGFLSDVCRAWEAATAPAEAAGVRTIHLRTGLVLSPAGGMLGVLGPVAGMGLAGWVGDGQDVWPWLAADDWVYAVHHLLGLAGTRGPYNLSAPAPAESRAFVKTLAGVLGRPAFASVPRGLVRVLGGEAAQEVALASVRMLPTRLEDAGFAFAYPDLDGALRHLYGRTPAPQP
ncbi:MAG TPA: TIGR01777 family oxidoreductase [Rubricoccaceae bacterium]